MSKSLIVTTNYVHRGNYGFKEVLSSDNLCNHNKLIHGNQEK